MQRGQKIRSIIGVMFIVMHFGALLATEQKQQPSPVKAIQSDMIKIEKALNEYLAKNEANKILVPSKKQSSFLVEDDINKILLQYMGEIKRLVHEEGPFNLKLEKRNDIQLDPVGFMLEKDYPNFFTGESNGKGWAIGETVQKGVSDALAKRDGFLKFTAQAKKPMLIYSREKVEHESISAFFIILNKTKNDDYVLDRIKLVIVDYGKKTTMDYSDTVDDRLNAKSKQRKMDLSRQEIAPSVEKSFALMPLITKQLGDLDIMLVEIKNKIMIYSFFYKAAKLGSLIVRFDNNKNVIAYEYAYNSDAKKAPIKIPVPFSSELQFKGFSDQYWKKAESLVLRLSTIFAEVFDLLYSKVESTIAKNVGWPEQYLFKQNTTGEVKNFLKTYDPHQNVFKQPPTFVYNGDQKRGELGLILAITLVAQSLYGESLPVDKPIHFTIGGYWFAAEQRGHEMTIGLRMPAGFVALTKNAERIFRLEDKTSDHTAQVTDFDIKNHVMHDSSYKGENELFAYQHFFYGTDFNQKNYCDVRVNVDEKKREHVEVVLYGKGNAQKNLDTYNLVLDAEAWKQQANYAYVTYATEEPTKNVSTPFYPFLLAKNFVSDFPGNGKKAQKTSELLVKNPKHNRNSLSWNIDWRGKESGRRKCTEKEPNNYILTTRTYCQSDCYHFAQQSINMSKAEKAVDQNMPDAFDVLDFAEDIVQFKFVQKEWQSFPLFRCHINSADAKKNVFFRNNDEDLKDQTAYSKATLSLQKHFREQEVVSLREKLYGYWLRLKRFLGR